MSLNWYGRPKNEPKSLKTSPIFFNFNQCHNCPFFLPNYFITLLVVWHRKTAKQSHDFCQSVCLTVRSPMLSLKSRSQYMYRHAQKNSGYGTDFFLFILLEMKFANLKCLTCKTYGFH